MTNLTPQVTAGDRFGGAMAYIFFALPILMDRKSEYTCFHMKQSFLLFVSLVIAGLIPILGSILSIVIFFHILFLMWKAYTGEKYSISYIYPHAEKLIHALSIENWFTPRI